ncbi:acyl carrier protein [Aestuariivita boseongensis]|uniref:acyl carrier protein n=1 Tax=Aestuariivita boseongensis TaxID=1470562 RepID=UPI0006805249|nr:phosphopantetheine-binding protein [Aestuariivita boseongensis]
MTTEDLRAIFVEELTRIAPDLDAADIGDDDHLQDDLGLDSMDILNLVTALHERLGVDVPEVDYPRISTLSLAVAYLRKSHT